jgi:23S rRNA (pseudouridine1915-N3)-methyltransferase
MKFMVVAIGHRMPQWIDAGFAEYEARIELLPLKAPLRGGSVERTLEQERERVEAALPAGVMKVALDERGTLLRTTELAKRITRWREGGRDVAFIIGGADGLAEGIKRSADFVWSLSPLTLPHGLARVVLAEQLYRAVSILHNHPYHRE